MEGLIKEEEIKIEYNETFERDPLENSFEFTSKYRKCNDNEEITLNSVNGNGGTPPPYTTQSTPSLSPLSNDCSLPDKPFQNKPASDLSSKITWYKKIDQSGKMYCKFCDLSYTVVQTLRYHVKKKHPLEAASLKEAISKSHWSRKLFCHVCYMRFETVGLLKQHVRCKHNLTKDKFICHYCQAVFLEKRQVMSHIYLRHIDKDGSFFKNVKKQLLIKTEIKNYSCPHCAHVAKRKYGLTTHIRAKHKTNQDPTFDCPFCPYKATIKYYLQNHVASKHPDSDFAKTKLNYLCDICGYKTPKKYHYTEHRKLHLSVEKKHKCEFCDYATSLSSNLSVHRRIHTKEKPYVCEYVGCKYRCAAKTSLNSHRLKHEPGKYALYCDKCNYKTVYRQSLRKHLDSHYRNKEK